MQIQQEFVLAVQQQQQYIQLQPQKQERINCNNKNLLYSISGKLYDN